MIVEDELTLAESLAYALKKEGFKVSIACDSEEGLFVFRQSNPHLIILDLMLPKMSGEEFCRQVRKESLVPILVISAKDTEIDKVVALELGADDYVTKPFSLREVIARVNSLLRRFVAASELKKKPLEVGPFLFNPADFEIFVSGQPLQLTPKELNLLTLFLENPNRVLTRELIIERVWGHDYYGTYKTIDIYIQKLRKKLGKEASKIKTVRGIGYKLEVS